MNDEAYSDARLNAILSAGFDLDRGDRLHLFEIDGELSDEALESLIVREAEVSTRNARSIAFIMRKWLRIRFQECMNNEDAHTLTRQEFQSCFADACESTCRNGLMNYATAAFLGKSRVDGELNSRQLYIAQMDWVAVPGQQQYKAAQDYIIATINRQAWAEDDSISDIDVERFEQELLAGYKGNCHIAQMAHGGGTPEEIGLAIFDECLAPSHCRGIRIGNRDPLGGTVEGSYHMLANDEEIGWHPDWRERVRKFKEEHGNTA